MTPRVLGNHPKAFERAKLLQQNPYPTTVAGFEAQAEAIRGYDSRPRLPQVTTPTLVLVGAEDVLTPVHQSLEMAALIPSSRTVVLPRGGHAVVIEYMADAVAAIRSFLLEP